MNEMFDHFRLQMAEVAVREELIRPFPGVKEAIAELQDAGIYVACDTGYSAEACEAIYDALSSRYGIKFDAVADSEGVRGRPTPFLVYDVMNKLSVYPPAAVVKADDITAGVQEGANSGAWAVGLYRTGAHNFEQLRDAGADFLVPGAKNIPDLVFGHIQPRLMRGARPGELPVRAEPHSAFTENRAGHLGQK